MCSDTHHISEIASDYLSTHVLPSAVFGEVPVQIIDLLFSCFLLCNCSLCILDTSSLSSMCVANRVYLAYLFYLWLLLTVAKKWKFCSLIKFTLSFFSFLELIFVVLSEIHHQNRCHIQFFPRDVIVSQFTFGSVIHFEIICDKQNLIYHSEPVLSLTSCSRLSLNIHKPSFRHN